MIVRLDILSSKALIFISFGSLEGNMHFKIIGAVLVGIVVLTASCGPKIPETATVKIESHEGNDNWRPNIVEVAAGGKVIWQNTGPDPRSVMSDQGLFNEAISPGQTFSFTFKNSGTYTYHDNPDTETNTVIVK